MNDKWDGSGLKNEELFQKWQAFRLHVRAQRFWWIQCMFRKNDRDWVAPSVRQYQTLLQNEIILLRFSFHFLNHICNSELKLMLEQIPGTFNIVACLTTFVQDVWWMSEHTVDCCNKMIMCHHVLILRAVRWASESFRKNFVFVDVDERSMWGVSNYLMLRVVTVVAEVLMKPTSCRSILFYPKFFFKLKKNKKKSFFFFEIPMTFWSPYFVVAFEVNYSLYGQIEKTSKFV